jgi:hypothetical protein
MKFVYEIGKNTPRQRAWLWAPLIPVGLTLFIGTGGLGKSTVVCDLAARVTSGNPFPLTTTEQRAPAAALYIGREDDYSSVVLPRFEAAGGNPNLFVRGNTVEEDVGAHGLRRFITMHDTDALDKVLEDLSGHGKPVRLLVFDPLSAFFGAGDWGRATVVRSVLDKLDGLAQSRELAIVIVTHIAMYRSKSPVFAGQGSVDFRNMARSVVLFGVNPADKEDHAICVVKSNWGRTGTCIGFRIRMKPWPAVGQVETIEWTGLSKLKEEDLLAAGRQSAVEKAEDFLLGYLAQPRYTQQVIEEAKGNGIRYRTLVRARDNLRKSAEIAAFKKQGKTFWVCVAESTQEKLPQSA